MVADLNQHTDEFLREYNPSHKSFQSEIESYGRHIGLTRGDSKGSLVFFKAGDPLFNRFNYGHEATHAVIHLGLEGFFMDMLKEEGFALDPFSRYDDEEQIAHVGGLVSLYKGNFHNKVNHPELSPLLEELMGSKR